MAAVSYTHLDLVADLLECSISGGVDLHDLDSYHTPHRRIRITATPVSYTHLDVYKRQVQDDPGGL